MYIIFNQFNKLKISGKYEGFSRLIYQKKTNTSEDENSDIEISFYSIPEKTASNKKEKMNKK